MTDHPASFHSPLQAAVEAHLRWLESQAPRNPTTHMAQQDLEAALAEDPAADLYAALERCIEVLEFAYMNAPKQPKEIKIGRQALAKAKPPRS